MAERNLTVNAGPPLTPTASVGDRVRVHGWPFFDGEPGTVRRVDDDPAHSTLYIVALDSAPDTPYAFWAGELEACNE